MHVAQPVSKVSIMPTPLELLGHGAPDMLSGDSLYGVYRGEPLLEGHVFIQRFSPLDGIEGRRVISPDGWRLARCSDDDCLLFDRRRDSLEMNNLNYLDSSSASIASHCKRLEKWQPHSGHPFIRVRDLRFGQRGSSPPRAGDDFEDDCSAERWAQSPLHS